MGSGQQLPVSENDDDADDGGSEREDQVLEPTIRASGNKGVSGRARGDSSIANEAWHVHQGQLRIHPMATRETKN